MDELKTAGLRSLNNAVRSGAIKIKPIDTVDASTLSFLHDSIFRVSAIEKTIYRCEACRQIQNTDVVKPRQDGIESLPQACENYWGSAYVPVKFAHSLDGSLVDPKRIELMLIGFAPGGATNEEDKPSVDILDIHSVPLGLKWADYGSSGAAVNRQNLMYILDIISKGVGPRNYFRLGHNVHMTNIFKCRSYGTSIGPFSREAQLCYERFLRNEISLLPNLKAIVMFFQKQKFPPLISSSDTFGTFRKPQALPLCVYLWHFANPGFNNSRKKGYFDEFCPRIGREIRDQI